MGKLIVTEKDGRIHETIEHSVENGVLVSVYHNYTNNTMSIRFGTQRKVSYVVREWTANILHKVADSISRLANQIA